MYWGGPFRNIFVFKRELQKEKQTRINEDLQMYLQETDIEKNLVAAGTFYASKITATTSHVKELTETWVEISRYLEDENLLIMLS